MFHVENEPVEMAFWRAGAERALRFPEKYVVDHERDAWLQDIGADGPTGAFVMRLGVGDSVVPLAATKTRHVRPDGGEYVLTDVFAFGASIKVTIQTGTPPYTFRDDAERDQLAVLTAEAILVTWTIRGRDNAVEGRNRVRVPLHDGPAEFTLSSFGYDLTQGGRTAEGLTTLNALVGHGTSPDLRPARDTMRGFLRTRAMDP